jgi:hypothetical protein
VTDQRRWPDDREAQARHHEFLRARGPIPPLAGCPIGWQPSALAPVFHSYRTYGAADGAPAPLRVFFPSADWPDSEVLMLEGCGRYPVILFAHGQCDGDDHPYQRWFRLPAQLARSGYVVVVPELSPDPPTWLLS